MAGIGDSTLFPNSKMAAAAQIGQSRFRSGEITSVQPSGGAAPASATFDPATASNVTFSGNNLVVTSAGGAVDHGAHVAAASGKTAGKYYFEVTITTYTGAGGADTCIGIGTPTSTYSGMGGGGGVTGDVVYYSGNVYANGTFLAASSILSFTGSGEVVAVAVDLDNRKIWFRRNLSGTWSPWNGNVSNDPASNVGGVTIPAGTMVPFVVFNANGNVWTTNFGASAFVSAVPSGFTAGWPA